MCVSPGYLCPRIQSDGSVIYRYARDKQEGFVVDELTGEVCEAFPVGCGRCPECIARHKNEWTARLLQEASLYKDNSFITLTYAAGDSSQIELVKRDVQLFMKRLRKRVGVPIRYYLCGEYGSNTCRPHYHVVIFGYGFPDKTYYKTDKKGFKMYRSAELESLWTFGYSSILPVCEGTLRYVTKDMQKLLPLNNKRQKPFTLMSTKPGIGYQAWDGDTSSIKIYVGGQAYPLPRYYLRRAEADGLPVADLKRKREQFGKACESIPGETERRQRRAQEFLKKMKEKT